MVKLQDTFKLLPPLTLDDRFIQDHSRSDKFLFKFMWWADKYASLSRTEFKLAYEDRLQEIRVDGYAWKTALKVISYILTLGILPAVAFCAKILYKELCAILEEIRREEIELELDMHDLEMDNGDEEFPPLMGGIYI